MTTVFFYNPLLNTSSRELQSSIYVNPVNLNFLIINISGKLIGLLKLSTFSFLVELECCTVKRYHPAVHGKALHGHVFKTLQLHQEDMCDINCYLEDRCQSYNLALKQDGMWECELSSSNDIQHPESLVSLPMKTYHATQVTYYPQLKFLDIFEIISMSMTLLTLFKLINNNC